MKKVVSIILVVLLTVSLTATTVFAEPPWERGGKFIPPGIAKKLFDDADEVKWAQKAIEKLMLKGLVRGNDGKFFPRRAVTKLEAVIMALRIMGWEEEALSVKKLPKKYKGKEIGDWAKGYVTVAYEKGILDEVDMMYFNPLEPVKRHEVAKYVIRALGYEEEAQDCMDEELPFVDAPAVPQGSVGYVYLINEMGIMKGDGERFNPMGTLTRAEMAVLFNSLDEKVDSEAEYSGVVYRVYDDSITIKSRGFTLTFEVSDDVVVYDEDGVIDYSDIQKGSKVLLKTEDGEVVYIEVIDEDDEDDKIVSTYTGKIIEIEYGDPDRITVQVERMEIRFEVIDDVEVLFKGDEGEFSKVRAGDDVTVTIDNKNRARKIYVHREREGQDEVEVEGTITDIDLSGIYHITIDDEEYELSEDAEVEIEGDEADLEDLVVGMEVEVKLEDGVVTYIEAEEAEYEVEGTITDIDLSGTYHITIDDEEYRLSEDAEVEIEGDEADLEDLVVGMEVEAKVEDGVVTHIEAEEVEYEVEGILEDADDETILVSTEDGIEEFECSEDLDIEIEDHSDTLSNLEKGMKVELRLVNDKVTYIYAEDNEYTVEGEITEISESSSGYQIELEVDGEECTYKVSEDVEIEIEEIEDPDIDDLEVGQEGKFEIVNTTIVEVEIED